MRNYFRFEKWGMTHNGFGLGEGGDFHHKPVCQQVGVDAESASCRMINHKCVCGALNRHFYQTRVSGCSFFFHLGIYFSKVSPLNLNTPLSGVPSHKFPCLSLYIEIKFTSFLSSMTL